ncbi:MAG TPA: hypothetical protein VIM65_18495 [Cyclobacteriaceae bacterium]
MRNYLFGILALIVMVGMKQQDKTQSIKYRTYETQNGREKKILYRLDVPKGGKLLTITGSHERELEVSYADSSFIYITNDANGGSHLNYKNISAIGKDVYTNKLLKDTLLLQGSQSNGRLWKESKMNHIVVGYVNVLPDKKVEYDKALASLKKN